MGVDCKLGLNKDLTTPELCSHRIKAIMNAQGKSEWAMCILCERGKKIAASLMEGNRIGSRLQFEVLPDGADVRLKRITHLDEVEFSDEQWKMMKEGNRHGSRDQGLVFATSGENLWSKWIKYGAYHDDKLTFEALKPVLEECITEEEYQRRKRMQTAALVVVLCSLCGIGLMLIGIILKLKGAI